MKFDKWVSGGDQENQLELPLSATNHNDQQPLTAEHIKVGSIVIVRGGFGTEEPEKVTVTHPLEEQKGRLAFGYTDKAARSRWAYTQQVSQVISL